MYRICKMFEIENGHFLSKNLSRCKMPHGHTRKVEVVLAAEVLDENDMVCDFKALKLALSSFIDSLDHAMVINTESEHYEYFKENFERLIPVDSMDPTSEVIAKLIFDHINSEIHSNTTYKDDKGCEYKIRDKVIVEKVRISEGSDSWAEYANI